MNHILRQDTYNTSIQSRGQFKQQVSSDTTSQVPQSSRASSCVPHVYPTISTSGEQVLCMPPAEVTRRNVSCVVHDCFIQLSIHHPFPCRRCRTSHQELSRIVQQVHERQISSWDAQWFFVQLKGITAAAAGAIAQQPAPADEAACRTRQPSLPTDSPLTQIVTKRPLSVADAAPPSAHSCCAACCQGGLNLQLTPADSVCPRRRTTDRWWLHSGPDPRRQHFRLHGQRPPPECRRRPQPGRRTSRRQLPWPVFQ